MTIGLLTRLWCRFFFSSRRRHTRFDCDWSSDVCSSDLVALQNKFRINAVACRFIDLVAAEIAIELVFVIVVASEIEAFTIWSKFLFFIQHHQLRCAPWLAWPPHVAPEFVIGFEVTPPDE